jgi:hypothetical protein
MTSLVEQLARSLPIREDPGLLPPFIAPLRLEESDSMKKARERILDFAGLHTGYCKSRVCIGQVKTMS